MSDDEIEEFIKELDTDGDHGVSWEEYVQGLFAQDLDEELPPELQEELDHFDKAARGEADISEGRDPADAMNADDG